MTVAELIKRLERCPQDNEIELETICFGGTTSHATFENSTFVSTEAYKTTVISVFEELQHEKNKNAQVICRGASALRWVQFGSCNRKR